MTGQEQLEQWLAGQPSCPNDQGECCPDFSCCRPHLLWPLDKRKKFMEGDQRTREVMMLGSLVGLVDEADAEVRVITGTEPKACSKCGTVAELRPYGENNAEICFPCFRGSPVGTPSPVQH